MAMIANARKVFHFAVEIGGLNQFLVQKVTGGEATQEATPHGDTNHDVYTPGRVSYSELVLEKIKASPDADDWAWNWFNAGQDPFTGGGVGAQNLKALVIVRELDSTGTVVLTSWAYEGCFVTKHNQSQYDRMSSDNIIETVTIRFDRKRKI